MTYDVSIEKLDLFCVFDLKGTRVDLESRLTTFPIALPENPNTLSRSGEFMLCWVGPTQWILRAAAKDEHSLLRELRPGVTTAKTSAVEVSDMLQFFSVLGPDACSVLAVGSPLDTHTTKFPENAITFTALFGVRALLLRDKDGFQFAVDRSYANFVDDNLHRVLGTSLSIDHAGAAAETIDLV